MENSRLKLSYFDARGVVETTRYMLAVTKTPYEDFRYGLTFGTPGDFSTIQRPEFDAAKAAGKLDANLGRLPLLERRDGDRPVEDDRALRRQARRHDGC